MKKISLSVLYTALALTAAISISACGSAPESLSDNTQTEIPATQSPEKSTESPATQDSEKSTENPVQVPDNDSILRKYAKENIHDVTDDEMIDTQPENAVTYTDLIFLLTDVTGDGINDLLAVGIEDNSPAVFDVYTVQDKYVKKIYNGHFGGYNGGFSYPTKYNGKFYICDESYSSATGFLKSLLKYENGEWDMKYSSHIVTDYDSGNETYDVNGKSVSREEYERFNTDIENNTTTIDDYCSIDEL